MGYLFVAIALLCGVTKGYCGKKTSGVLVNQSDAMLVNAVRMLACIAVGLVIVAVQNDFASLAATKKLILAAILSGVSTAAFTVSWLLSVRQGGLYDGGRVPFGRSYAASHTLSCALQ